MKLNEQLLDKVVGGENTDGNSNGAPGKLGDATIMLCGRCPARFSYPPEGSGTIACPNCGFLNTYYNH